MCRKDLGGRVCWSIIAAVGRASSALHVGEEPVGKELEVHNIIAILLEDFYPRLFCILYLYLILVSLNLVFKSSMSS